jgi:hypothetical protein
MEPVDWLVPFAEEGMKERLYRRAPLANPSAKARRRRFSKA